LALVAGLSLSAGVLLWRLESLVAFAMTPTHPFKTEPPPPKPNYEDGGSWSALPGRHDEADKAPAGSPAIPEAIALADVFYIHPTSYVGKKWNAPTDDPQLNRATDTVATGIQAAAFNACCVVYAPRYRQANGVAFFAPSLDGRKAIDVAYADIERAFQSFLARRGSERPFLLAAHSQGSVLGERLLVEKIAGTKLESHLVAAYLIGGQVTTRGLAQRAPGVPPCTRPDQVHCVVAWNARGPGFEPNRFDFHPTDASERLCTNPLTWSADGAAAPANRNLGAVFLETGNASPLRAFADARCEKGVLVVSQIGNVPRNLPSQILDRVMGAGNYHPIEYQTFFMNLRENATVRVTAFQNEFGRLGQQSAAGEP
jgi:Protein of unknown function (DUF3089)